MYYVWLVIFSLTVVYGTDPDLSVNNTWRCGVFIPDPDKKYEEPSAKFFVFQKEFEAKCPPKLLHTSKNGVFSQKCKKMGQDWEKLWSPSKEKSTGISAGDEICQIMSEELVMPEIPNESFPNGVQLGYFFNYCETNEWKDTAVRSEHRICCKGGKYKGCDGWVPGNDNGIITKENSFAKVESSNDLVTNDRKKETEKTASAKFESSDDVVASDKATKTEETKTEETKTEKTASAKFESSNDVVANDKATETEETKPKPTENMDTSSVSFTTSSSIKSEKVSTSVQSFPISFSGSLEKTSPSLVETGGSSNVLSLSSINENYAEPMTIQSHKVKLLKGEDLNQKEINEINWFIYGMKASASHILEAASEFENLLKKKTSP